MPKSARERERSCKERKESAAATAAVTSSSSSSGGGGGGGSGDEEGGEGGTGGSEQKGAPSSEATVRTRRGIASHTGPSAGTGPDRDRNSPGPRAPGPAVRARARDRENDRREPHTRLAHVRAVRAVNTNRVFFILGATSPLSPPCLPPPSPSSPPPPPPRSAAAVSFSCFHPFFFLQATAATATSPARGDFALFSPVFHCDTFAAF